VHFNIGKKIEINPFENVKYVVISSNISNGTAKLDNYLHKKAVEVTTKKINDRFIICFNVELLDFTTLLTWFEPFRGKFLINTSSVHFRIEKDIMYCW
jgi:hypothetical protein